MFLEQKIRIVPIENGKDIYFSNLKLESFKLYAFFFLEKTSAYICLSMFNRFDDGKLIEV